MRKMNLENKDAKDGTRDSSRHIGYALRRGAPVDGPQGTLAGVAEPGAELFVQSGAHAGSWLNQGTKEAPIWRRRYADSPIGRL